MDINVFTKYKVKYTCEYSYINEYGDFSDGHSERESIVDGYTFLTMVYKHIENYDFIRMLAQDKMVYIETFNPNTGETADYTYEYEETEENEV